MHHHDHLFQHIHPSIDPCAQCSLVSNHPMSPHFLTVGEFPELQAIGLALVFWATACVGLHPLCYWISFVFLLYGRRICTHLVDSLHPSLTHFLGKFSGLGLALVADVVV